MYGKRCHYPLVNGTQVIDIVEKRRKGYGKCKICPAEADGLHYGVVTCGGCNFFFRRSILQNKTDYDHKPYTGYKQLILFSKVLKTERISVINAVYDLYLFGDEHKTIR